MLTSAFQRRIFAQPFMIWYAVSLHLLYGSVLAFSDVPTLVALLGGFDWLLDLAGAKVSGVFLILVSLIAAGGLLLESKIPRKASLGCMLPQYIVLLYALVSGLEKIFFGFSIYSETQQTWIHVPYPSLLAGIGPICLAAIWHTFALLGRVANYPNQGDKQEMLQAHLSRELEARLRAEAALRNLTGDS